MASGCGRMISRIKAAVIESERGQAAVELALCAPILLVVLLASVGLADAGRKRAVVARAAMYGSRLAVVDAAPAVRRQVAEMAVDLDASIEPRRLSVRVTRDNWPFYLRAFANPVTVTVKYDAPLLGAFGWSPRIAVSQSYTADKWSDAIIADFGARD